MEILQRKVALNKTKLPFHLALGARLSAIDRLDVQPSQQILVLCLRMDLMGLELVAFIGEDGLGQSPPGEGFVQHHEDVDLVLMEEPAA